MLLHCYQYIWIISIGHLSKVFKTVFAIYNSVYLWLIYFRLQTYLFLYVNYLYDHELYNRQ